MWRNSLHASILPRSTKHSDLRTLTATRMMPEFLASASAMLKLPYVPDEIMHGAVANANHHMLADQSHRGRQLDAPRLRTVRPT